MKKCCLIFLVAFLSTDYVKTQRILELKREKPLTEKTLQAVTNMRFEFEDYRIENRGTQPSRTLLDLYEVKLENRLPQTVPLKTTQSTIQYNVAGCSPSSLLMANSGLWKDSTGHHRLLPVSHPKILCWSSPAYLVRSISSLFLNHSTVYRVLCKVC